MRPVSFLSHVTLERIPWWLRTLDRIARLTERFARLVAAVRDESAMAWILASDRGRLTSFIFDRQRTYSPGGNIFKRGLFPWEEELLEPPFPQSGRILVGGAGGGREAVALIVSDEERLALLRALRKLAPRAPVVLSFDEPVDSEIPGSRVGRARASIRRLYARMGAPGYTGERMRYAAWAGILRESSLEEVGAIARAAGYTVAKQRSSQGRMLLMPAIDA